MNFFRGWEAYRDGFGKLTGEHWLGAWGWQCPLLGGLAKSGEPPQGEVWGFLCKGRDTETPLAGTHVLGMMSRAGGEGTGWLHRGREAMGLFARERSTSPWLCCDNGARAGGWEPLPVPPCTPSPGTPSHPCPCRGPRTHPLPPPQG